MHGGVIQKHPSIAQKESGMYNGQLKPPITSMIAWRWDPKGTFSRIEDNMRERKELARRKFKKEILCLAKALFFLIHI